MKLKSILTMTLLAMSSGLVFGAKTQVEQVHPLCWWAGMQNPEFQLLLHGTGIREMEVELKDADHVTITEVVRQESPNYLILYLNTREAKPQTFNIVLTPRKGTKGLKKTTVQYELKARQQVDRKSFDASDVVYLLMPDRFASGSDLKTTITNMKEKAFAPTEDFGRHGGDLAGMEQHLDYLADLGITAIWPTPLLVNDMPKESYHGYAITDFYQIDPRIGSNEDYRHFIAEAHKRGIKIIKDIVFNHCGSENFLFTDMPQPDWFNFDGKYVQSSYRTGAVGDIHAAVNDRRLTIDGWFVPAMPDLNQRNRLVCDYLIQASLWWIEWAGIDGIRQDTYPYNDFDAMVKWCNRVEQEYPGFNIVGEVWINNNVGVSYWQKDSKLCAPRNTQLKTVMDFPLMALLNSVVDEETDEWNTGLARLYEYLSQDVVYADPLHLLTFLDNHDTDRFQKNDEMAQDTTRYKQALTMLLTLRGIPQLYYGDEIGMAANKGKGDGALRQNFPGGWKDDKNNAFTKEGRTDLQNWYFNFTRNLLQWRKQNRTVQFGNLTHFHVRGGVYVYARQLDGQIVTVIINGTNKAQTLDLAPYAEVLPKAEAVNVLTKRKVQLGAQMQLKKREVRVLDFSL